MVLRPPDYGRDASLVAAPPARSECYGGTDHLPPVSATAALTTSPGRQRSSLPHFGQHAASVEGTTVRPSEERIPPVGSRSVARAGDAFWHRWGEPRIGVGRGGGGVGVQDSCGRSALRAGPPAHWGGHGEMDARGSAAEPHSPLSTTREERLVWPWRGAPGTHERASCSARHVPLPPVAPLSACDALVLPVLGAGVMWELPSVQIRGYQSITLLA